MRHATEAELVRAADESLDATELAAFEAHVESCAACRGELDAQIAARRALNARPIEPVRDLSAAIRAALEAERPWIERLNWRRLSIRVAPIAAALTLAAFLLVRTADTSPAAETVSADPTVASALYSGEVSEDQLLGLLLNAQPDDSLSTYVTPVSVNKEK